MIEKECKKCFLILSLDSFNKQKSTKTGYRSWCKSCYKVYLHNYYKENKEQIRDKQKVYSELNKDTIRETKRLYYLNNIDKIQEYRLINKDHIKHTQKEYRLKNYHRLRSYMKNYLKEYGIKHKEYLSKPNQLGADCIPDEFGRR